MLKRSLAAGLLACAALTPVAMAQDNAQSSPGNVQFIKTIESNQYRGSQLMGQNVYNQQDETIGSIGDALIDRNGKVSAVVISVGGFLGIGASEVAVSFDALQFEKPKDEMASSASAPAGSGESGRSATAGGAADATSNTSSSAPAQSGAQGDMAAGSAGTPWAAGSGAASGDNAAGSASGGAAGTGSGGAAADQSAQNAGGQDQTQSAASGDFPYRIVLNATREQLQNAPKLEQDEQQSQPADQSGSGAAK